VSEADESSLSEARTQSQTLRGYHVTEDPEKLITSALVGVLVGLLASFALCAWGGTVGGMVAPLFLLAALFWAIHMFYMYRWSEHGLRLARRSMMHGESLAEALEGEQERWDRSLRARNPRFAVFMSLGLVLIYALALTLVGAYFVLAVTTAEILKTNEGWADTIMALIAFVAFVVAACYICWYTVVIAYRMIAMMLRWMLKKSLDAE
jgi:hypothetical protein